MKWDAVCLLWADVPGSQPQGNTTRSVQPLHLQQELLRVINVFKTLTFYFLCGSFSIRAWMTRSYFNVRSLRASQTIRQRTLVKPVLPEDHSPWCGCGGALVAILPCSLCLHPVSHQAGSRVYLLRGCRRPRLGNKDILKFLSHCHHRDPDPLEYSGLTCIISVSSSF